jgi:hypothetical protein
MKSAISWDETPYSSLKVNQRFGGTYGLPLHDRRIGRAGKQRESNFTLVFCSSYPSILKMEAIYSSETSIGFKRTTQRYILKYSTLLYIISYMYKIFYFVIYKTNIQVSKKKISVHIKIVLMSLDIMATLCVDTAPSGGR